MTSADVLTLTDDAAREPARLGRVIASTGTQALVLIEHDGGDGPVSLRTGDVVLIGSGSARAVAIVTAMSVPAPATENDVAELWIAETRLCGTMSAEGFDRGGGALPSLGDPACRVSSEDLAVIYGGVMEAGRVESGEVEAVVAISDKLVRGFGVFGTTGSGKSATMAVLVRALLRNKAPVRPVLLDLRDEYGRSFGRVARVIKPTPGFLPHWLLSFAELRQILERDGGPIADDEAGLLADGVVAARRRMLHRLAGAESGPVTLDAPVPYRVNDVLVWLERTATDDRRRGSAHRRLRDRLTNAQEDPSLAPIFGGLSARDTLADFLGEVFCLRGTQPMSVLQLGTLSDDLAEVAVSAVCRLARLVGQASGASQRLLILIDDVERCAPRDDDRAAACLSRSAIETLVAGGKRWGVGVGFASARPGAVSSAVLRGTPTYLVHRTPDDADRDRLAKTMPDGAGAMLAAAAGLADRTAVVAGAGFGAPGTIKLSTLPSAALPTSAGGGRLDPQQPNFLDLAIERIRFGLDVGYDPDAGQRSAPPPAPPPPPVTPAA